MITWRAAVVAISLLMLSACDKLDRAVLSLTRDDRISVVQNEDGMYSCKLGRVLASVDFPTPDKAREYCEGWRKIWLRDISREDKKWKVVEEAE